MISVTFHLDPLLYIILRHRRLDCSFHFSFPLHHIADIALHHHIIPNPALDLDTSLAPDNFPPNNPPPNPKNP